MAKPLVRLDEETRRQLAELAENGMDYYIVVGRLASEGGEREGEEQVLIIGGHLYVVPFDDPRYFSLVDLLEGEVFPSEAGAVLDVRNMKSASAQQIAAAAQRVSLPPGYVPARGAIPLLGRLKLDYDAVFYRYVGDQPAGQSPDPRLVKDPNSSDPDARMLTKGTYLTAINDIGYANTGFAAVGRYALPLPVPARNQLGYELPKDTELRVGTVLPKFGQAGGGVEVRLVHDTPVTPLDPDIVPDF